MSSRAPVIDRASESLPAWVWILLGWLVGGATRLGLERWLGAEAGPFAIFVVVAVWLPAVRRLRDVSGGDQLAFVATLLATVVLMGLLPPFEHLALRLPVEIAITVPAAARWIDRAYDSPGSPPTIRRD